MLIYTCMQRIDIYLKLHTKQRNLKPDIYIHAFPHSDYNPTTKNNTTSLKIEKNLYMTNNCTVWQVFRWLKIFLFKKLKKIAYK